MFLGAPSALSPTARHHHRHHTPVAAALPTRFRGRRAARIPPPPPPQSTAGPPDFQGVAGRRGQGHGTRGTLSPSVARVWRLPAAVSSGCSVAGMGAGPWVRRTIKCEAGDKSRVCAGRRGVKGQPQAISPLIYDLKYTGTAPAPASARTGSLK